jgi:hypothetical protein
VSDVAVAEVTVPTAPLLRVTVLLPAVVSKSKPLIVTVVELAARLFALALTAGVTVATCTAEPLLTPLVVTVAAKLPTADGMVEIVTVSDVAVEEVTVPTAPLVKETVLLAGVVLKPLPAIVSVVALAASAAVLAVTVGPIVATCTEELLAPSVVTMAVIGPVTVGGVLKVTVSDVADAAVTVPTGVAEPSTNATVLLFAVGSKPWPAMISVVVPEARLVVLLVTTGVGVAICTGALLAPFVVTTAVNAPALVGAVESVTVSKLVLVATTPDTTAPLLSTTVLLLDVVSKPTPLMRIVVAEAAG